MFTGDQSRTRSLSHTVVDADNRSIAYDLKELWNYRELWWHLAHRDITVRYKQAFLGAAWVILQPFMMMVTFSIFLGFLVRVPSGNTPYPLFVYTGLLLWQCFTSALSRITISLTGSGANMITKIYFPRLVLPLASTVPPVVDMGYAFIVFIGMMGYYRYAPTWQALYVPLFILLALLTALGVGVWLAVWNVKYRDVEHLLPVLTQIWMFASPVAYPASLVPERWRVLYGLNPMAGVVEGFRWSLLGDAAPSWQLIAVSGAVSLAFLLAGLAYFRRVERHFADYL